MSPLDQLIPIVCLAFIVWRMANNKRKGRVIIDLWPLNNLAIPNAYLLPDQEEIKGEIRGKKYYSIFNGIGFFHQLPVL